MFDVTTTVHFVGIGGAGMSGIARVLARQGLHVTGSDLRETPTLCSLREEYGITTYSGHSAEQVGEASLVVVSAAIKKTNPEIQAARSRGIPVISRAEMLGRLMSKYPRSVAVTGTHGKTTTSAMTAVVLAEAGLDPTVLIGGDVDAFAGNARLGSGDIFVAEACEAFDSFLDLDPYLAVITNIEADHLDYYGDLDNVLRSFRKFMTQVTGCAVVCADDPNVQMLVDEVIAIDGIKPEIVTYGLCEKADMTATQIAVDGPFTSYTAVWRGRTLGEIHLRVPGLHNIANSLAALAVGMILDVPFPAIARALQSFTGATRRFEHLGQTDTNVLVIDDYAHHPTEIRATLSAAAKAYPDRRIVAVFQPHLPSRTRDFRAAFAESFAEANQVVLTDIYLAREQPIEGVTGAGLAALTADRRGAAHVTYVAEASHLPARLVEMTKPGDLLITLGAGDIRDAAEGFLKAAADCQGKTNE